MVIDYHEKRFVMNRQLRQCFTRAKLFRLKKARFCLAFHISKKSQRCLKKAVATDTPVDHEI